VRRSRCSCLILGSAWRHRPRGILPDEELRAFLNGIARVSETRSARTHSDCFRSSASTKGKRAKGFEQSLSWTAEFILQPPDDVCDEIVKSPTDAVSHLLHVGQPVAELGIQVPRFTAQQEGEFV
jgi:hypothetical protein